jgi:hypothetical protein
MSKNLSSLEEVKNRVEKRRTSIKRIDASQTEHGTFIVQFVDGTQQQVGRETTNQLASNDHVDLWNHKQASALRYSFEQGAIVHKNLLKKNLYIGGQYVNKQSSFT